MADKADAAADEAVQNGDKDASTKKDAAKKAQEHAAKAEQAAQEAADAMANGDMERAEKAAQKAEEEAQKANEAAAKAGVYNNKNNGDSRNSSNNPTKPDKPQAGNGPSDPPDPFDWDQWDNEEAQKERTKAFKDLADKMTGSIGTFNKKCKESKKGNKNGIAVKTYGSKTSWDVKVFHAVKTYVAQKIFEKKKEMKRSYSRVKRGSGFVTFGQPIQPGKIRNKDKMLLSINFFTDCSGSMSSGDAITNALNLTYAVADKIAKMYGRDPVIAGTAFKYYVFNTTLTEIKYKKMVPASGNTFEFEKLLKNIKDKGANAMVNMIITDAGFFGIGDLSSFFKDVDGIVILITNSYRARNEFQDIEKKFNKQFIYIESDANFSLSDAMTKF